MISKKALLIAMGLSCVLPIKSYALTRAELLKQMEQQLAMLEAEETKALDQAKAKTAEIAKNAASKQAQLDKEIASVNELLKDARLTKKAEYEAAINKLNSSVKDAFDANQKRLASERELNKQIIDKHNKRVKLVSKAIDALTNIVKA